MTLLRRWISPGALVGIVGLALVAWRTHHVSQELTRSLSDLDERRNALVAETDRLKRNSANLLASQPAQRPAQPSPAATPEAKEAASAALAQKPWRDIVLEEDPQLQAQYFVFRRAGLVADYAAFLQKKRLTIDQIEQFKDVMLTAEERAMDLNATIQAEALNENDPVVKTLRDEAAATLAAEQQELLGDSGYRELLDYQRALPARAFVEGLRAPLLFSGEPLSSEQVDLLTQALADSNEAYRHGGTATPVDPSSSINPSMFRGEPAREPVDFEQVLAQAKPNLTPEQYSAVTAELQRGHNLIELFNAIRQTPGDRTTGFVIVSRKE